MGRYFSRTLVVFIFSYFLFQIPALAQSKDNEVKEIVVVSLLGDNFVGRKISILKKNRLWYAPVSSWGIDDLAEATTLKYLQQKPGVSGVAWDVYFECLKEISISKKCRNEFFSKAKENGVKYVLVIAPASSYQSAPIAQDYSSLILEQSTAPKIPGSYGYYKYNKLKCVYALFSVGVYDVETGKSVGRVRKNEKSDLIKSGFPCYSKRYRDKKTEEKISWQNSFDEYSPRQKEQMKGYIIKGIEEDLLRILPKLKLFKE